MQNKQYFKHIMAKKGDFEWQLVLLIVTLAIVVLVLIYFSKIKTEGGSILDFIGNIF